MDDSEWLARRFEEHRPRLRAVAYRMLGSLGDAEDAVQNAWLRLHRADPDEIDNLGAWLTTVVARECLHSLRTRRRRREDLVDLNAAPLPDPIISSDRQPPGPEEQALLAESVSLAMLTVLDALSPPERLAFVLHDMFALPFDQIAAMLGRTPAATRQLASRARKRVRGAELPAPLEDYPRQRAVVDAFLQAAHDGDLAKVIELLHPDVVLRADYGATRPPAVHRGADTIARQSRAAGGAEIRPARVNGLPGIITSRDGRLLSVMAFTVVDGRIAAIDGIRDADRVARLVEASRPGDEGARPLSGDQR